MLLVLICTVSLATQRSRAAGARYETLFYSHGGLRLQAYLYKPAGGGPFPLLVYNHGSRAGQERAQWPAAFIARIFVPRGYGVLVPERRGYGKSDGPTLTADLGEDRGRRYVARVRLEANDVLAATNYVLKTRDFVDPRRVAIMGFSFGASVTTLAAADDQKFAAAVVQAPDALSWDRSAELREALVDAARRIRVPTFCAVAANDATTESTRAVCDAVQGNGTAAELKIYPPFTPRRSQRNAAAGHALFGPDGAALWTDDVVEFLERALPPPRR